MHNPAGLVLSPDGHLWVAESNRWRPKRLAAYDLVSNSMWKEFFGPTDYGAPGASFDPQNPAHWDRPGHALQSRPRDGNREAPRQHGRRGGHALSLSGGRTAARSSSPMARSPTSKNSGPTTRSSRSPSSAMLITTAASTAGGPRRNFSMPSIAITPTFPSRPVWSVTRITVTACCGSTATAMASCRPTRSNFPQRRNRCPVHGGAMTRQT